jgi:cell wall assembly regulator SMI1
MTPAIQRAWARIDDWLTAYVPRLADELYGPCDEDELAEAAGTLGFALPEALAAHWRVHDGQRARGQAVMGAWRLLSLQGCLTEWQVLEEAFAAGEFRDADRVVRPQDGVRPVWWDLRWLPVARHATGTLACVDLRPGEGGRAGQVVAYEAHAPERVILAPSLGDWLEAFAADLEGWRYEVEEDTTLSGPY